MVKSALANVNGRPERFAFSEVSTTTIFLQALVHYHAYHTCGKQKRENMDICRISSAIRSAFGLNLNSAFEMRLNHFQIG